jgi:hypothetical protein
LVQRHAFLNTGAGFVTRLIAELFLNRAERATEGVFQEQVPSPARTGVVDSLQLLEQNKRRPSTARCRRTRLQPVRALANRHRGRNRHRLR